MSPARSGGVLNDLLAKGHKLVASLFKIFVNFRLGSAAVSADIAKFYNQTPFDPGYFQ